MLRRTQTSPNLSRPHQPHNTLQYLTIPHRTFANLPDLTKPCQTLPIQQPSQDRTANSSDPMASSPRSATQAMTTILSALSIVLGAFFLVVWLTRSASKRRWSPLPSEAVQLLGRTPLAGRQWMQLIRVGNKLVMVSVNGNQVDTITEITDPEEVEHLVSLCHKNQSNQFRQTFQQVLNQHQQNDPNEASSRSFQHEHSYFANTG